MQAFVAIDLPDVIHAVLAQKQAEFRAACDSHRDARITWTRPEGIHLTLKFLGEISDAQVKPVTAALAALGPFEKFPVEVKGFGFFPDSQRPRVFWAGLEAPWPLSELAARVEMAMEELGFPREQRSFNPHLTLARFKAPSAQPALDALLGQQAELSLGRFEVADFFLFESRLSPHGAEYRKVARFPQ